jgi:hypothetical protein
MGGRGACLQPSRPSDRDPRLCLVIADRRQHKAPVLCRVAYRAGQLTYRGGAGGDRGGAPVYRREIVRAFFAQLITAVIAAIIGAVIAISTLTGQWFWTSFSEKFWYDLSSNVIGHMDFAVSASPAKDQHVEWKCPEGTQLVSASCTETRPNPDVAVGPTYNPDRSFSCDRSGAPGAAVQATAICFKVRK